MLTTRSILIALTILLIIWVVILYVRVFFGQTTINKLTMKPFNYAFAALSTKLILEITKLFYNAETICFKENGASLKELF